MKGAKGLLISITGGKDLALYEVDEAATRIREEVDSDANIIVGATFDESLDGIVRVSVVATGIDVALSARQPQPAQLRQPAVAPVAVAPVQAPTPAPQAVAAASRLAELTQSLRANTQRMAERTERTDQAHRAVAQALSVAPVAPAPEAPVAPPVAEVDASVAIEDVTIRPIAPKPSLFLEPVETVAEAAPAPVEPEKPFIPPQAERPALRAPRMPRIEELPIPAQNQIRARQAETTAEQAPKQRVSLLQRLASVGLGRREEEEAPAARPAPAPEQRAAPPMPKAPAMPPLPRAAEARPESVSEYAKRPVAQRPAPQGLDQHGRQAPVNNSLDDDQLEIPAFLRRQVK
jgi:cell division protein FtsZ